MRFHALAASCLLACGLSVSLDAESQAAMGQVLTGREVTRERLVEALEPSPSRTRSLKIGAAGSAIPQPASAALLITFRTDSAELTAESRRLLDVVASAMSSDRLATYRFKVEGHADPRGNPSHNLALSMARAESVKRYLTTEHAISGERLQPSGKGDLEPLNRQVPAAPENRRVTFITQE